MGNYAGNFNIEDIDWLSGLIDSDGSINLSKYKTKRNISLQPKVAIYNANDDIITNACVVLNKFGEIQELWEKTKKEEEIILTSPEIFQDLEDSQEKSVVQQTNVVRSAEQYEEDAKKPTMIVPTAGVAPDRSEKNPVG